MKVQQNKVVIYVVAAAVAALVLGFVGFKVLENDGDPVAQAASSSSAGAETTAEKIMAAVGPLGDMEMGSKDAPVVIVEYASLTCSHCAEFDKTTLPPLKANYIDTGKVRYILREFPYDEFATSAFMLSRCAGKERYFGFVDVLFKKQAEWAYSENPLAGLLAISKQGGFSEGSFDACMKNQQIFEHIRDVATRGRTEFGVASTPTFFVNGEKVEGALPYAEFEKVVQKHLPAEQP